jgi:hypothetical protein
VTAIAAGANRSLLVVQRHLDLLAPTWSAGNGITLWLGYSDGGPVESGRLNNLEIRATTNLNLALANWLSYTNGFVLTNNLIRWNDPDAVLLPRRYYRLIEWP